VINFSDEEGRFGSLVGSHSFCGVDGDQNEMFSSTPTHIAPRINLKQAIEETGLESERPFRLHDDQFFKDRYFGFFEAHIEQGRRLERSKIDVAAVTGLVGLRQAYIEFTGESNHAGTTMMRDRRDAARAAFRYAAELQERLCGAFQDTEAVWTIGDCKIIPGAASIIPSDAILTVQWRAASNELMDRLKEEIKAFTTEYARKEEESLDTPNGGGVHVSFKDSTRLNVQPVAMDEGMVSKIEAAAATSEATCTRLVSGALHDAGIVAKLGGLPAVMLFVPSIDGISHDFREDTHEDDIVMGAEVYARAAESMLRLSA